MAPKKEGRLVEDQRRREDAGLSWKSASTLERQRQRARNRKGKGQEKGKDKGPDKGKGKDHKGPAKGKGSKTPAKGPEAQVKGAKGQADTPAPSTPRVPPAPPPRRNVSLADVGPQGFPAPRKAGARMPRAKGQPRR